MVYQYYCKNIKTRDYFNSDDARQHDHTNDTMEYALISREKTKKGPPVNKHISVRNIKAQIANMSSNECAGFKSEYHVRPNIRIYFFNEV